MHDDWAATLRRDNIKEINAHKGNNFLFYFFSTVCYVCQADNIFTDEEKDFILSMLKRYMEWVLKIKIKIQLMKY